MPRGIIPNRNTNGFKQNPQNINRKGAPKRFVSTIIKELDELGIENVKPSQIVDLYEKLLNCTIKQLTDLANEESGSWEVRQTAKYMLKYPEKAWSDIIDRAHGKSIAKTELTGKDGKDLVTVLIVKDGDKV